MKPIHLRNVPPPSETFDHVTFLNFMCSWIKPECYLELGVRDGRNFFSVAKHCQKAIGVDIVSCSKSLLNNMEFHICNTDEYFKNLNDDIKFDVVFIDADHSHEQSLKDFLNVKDKVIDDGFIFFHDTQTFGDTGEDGKEGIKKPILDFLLANEEWKIVYIENKNNGMIILSK